jgi:hypothetical protein
MLGFELTALGELLLGEHWGYRIQDYELTVKSWR